MRSILRAAHVTALVSSFVVTLALPALAQQNAPPTEWGPQEEQSRNAVCTLFTGSAGDRTQGVFVMGVGPNAGKILIAGDSASTDFQTQFGLPSPAPFDSTHNGTSDAYVAILDADMTHVDHWTYFGGAQEDRAYYAMEDADGKIWVSGVTQSSNFPTGSPHAVSYGSSGSGNPPPFDVFVARFSFDLHFLEVTTRFSGGGTDSPRGTLFVDSDAVGGVYISGGTDSLDFPYPGGFGSGIDSSTGTAFNFCPGNYCTVSQYCVGGSRCDAFVIKLDRSTGAQLWTRILGGAEDDNAWGNVRIDPLTHDVYIAGCTQSSFSGTGTSGLIDTNYDLINQPTYGARSGPADGFVAKLDPATAKVKALAYIGGSGTDWVAFNDCMELDNQARPVVMGLTRSGDLPLAGQPLNSTHSQGANPDDCDFESNDIFVAKFSTDLSTLVYSSYVNEGPGSGGKADKREECAGLATYRSFIYLSGETDSPGSPVLNAFDPTISSGHTEYASCPPICPMPIDVHDAFLIRIFPGVSAASGLHYGTFFGGNQTGTSAAEPGNRGRCLAVFESGTYAGMALFSGVTTATDFGAVGGVGGLTTPGVVQRDWLTGDQRAGFIAIHDVY